MMPSIRPFSFYTKRSFGMHFFLLLLLALLSYIRGSFSEKQRHLNIKLIESSVRVDVVAMPRMTLLELRALQKSGVRAKDIVDSGEREGKDSKPEEGKQEGNQENDFLKQEKHPKKNLSFSDLIKKYSQKKIKEKVKRGKGHKKTDGNSRELFNQRDLSRLKGLINRGNKVSSGNALVGGGSDLYLTELQEYATTVSDQVREFWKLPSYLAEKKLQCRIKIFINERGELIRAEVFESSEEKEYDSRALQSIQAASPFPVPVQEIRGRLLRGDILLGFPL